MSTAMEIFRIRLAELATDYVFLKRLADWDDFEEEILQRFEELRAPKNQTPTPCLLILHIRPKALLAKRERGLDLTALSSHIMPFWKSRSFAGCPF